MKAKNWRGNSDFLGRAIWVGRKYLSDDWIAEADLMISERRKADNLCRSELSNQEFI